MKVLMLESQAGASYTRDAGTIWSIPNGEAERMIKAGICKKYEAGSDMEAGHKQELAQVHGELQTVYGELDKAVKEIELLQRQVKSLSNEIKKSKESGGKKTGSKKRKSRKKSS